MKLEFTGLGSAEVANIIVSIYSASQAAFDDIGVKVNKKNSPKFVMNLIRMSATGSIHTSSPVTFKISSSDFMNAVYVIDTATSQMDAGTLSLSSPGVYTATIPHTSAVAGYEDSNASPSPLPMPPASGDSSDLTALAGLAALAVIPIGLIAAYIIYVYYHRDNAATSHWFEKNEQPMYYGDSHGMPATPVDSVSKEVVDFPISRTATSVTPTVSPKIGWHAYP